MGSIKVNLDGLAGCAIQFHTVAITLEDLKSSMDHVFGSVDSKIKRRRNIDGSIADIQKSMKALYTEIENISLFVSSSKDTYEKMETRLEKESNSFIDRMEDIAGLKKEWYQENWFKLAVGTVVTGIAIAAVVIAGPELMVIAVCTVVGGGISGITEGIESVKNGGTFIDGFSDGFMWGSIGGFASGAVIVSGAGLVASSYAGGAIDSAVYAGRCIQDGRTVTAEGVVGNFVTGAAVWAGGTLILGKVAKCAEERLAKSAIDEVTTAGNSEIVGKEAKEIIAGGKGTVYGTDDIVNYKYNMIENPGPLAELRNNPAQNFYGGRYNAEVLTEDKIYYRGGNSDNPLGQWFTAEPPESVAKVRIDTAVKPQWIDPVTGELTGESIVDTVYAIKIPKGTTVYPGPVGFQGGVFCGGYDIMQTFIETPWKLDYKVISKTPLY